MIEIFRNGKKMSPTQESTWIGKICSQYLIAKMHDAGYDADTIARVGGYSESTVWDWINRFEASSFTRFKRESGK